jgi:HEAT repeat protein
MSRDWLQFSLSPAEGERAGVRGKCLVVGISARLPFLISLLVWAVFAPAAASAEQPTKADIAKVVATASAYQPGQSREPFRRMEEWLRQSSSSGRKQLEAGLVQLLSPGSAYEAQEFACTQLGIIGSATALPALSGLLKSDDTARIACLALTTYPAGKADEILRAALPAAAGIARIQIINTLGDRRDARAVRLLAPLASDADLPVARAAIAALGKIGDPAAWKVIAALPKDAQPELQSAMTEATLRCAEARAAARDAKAANALYESLLASSQPTYVRRAALDALLRLDKAQAQQRILEVLHGSDTALKPVAIAYVRALPAGNASEVFAAELPKLEAPEQVWMLDSLAARGDTPACTVIGNSVASPHAAVRRAAIDALGRIGSSWCVPLLARALAGSTEADERRAVESALIVLPGGAQTDRAIITALKNASGGTRALLVTAIARREGAAANTLLLAEAGRPDTESATAALRALSKTAGSQELTPLLELLTRAPNAEVRAEAESASAQAIARTPSPARRSAAVKAALGWAQADDSRAALIGLLPACGDAAALNALKAATVGSDTRLRAAAVRALADWPDASGWDAMVAVLHQPVSEAARGLIMRGLVRLAGEENVHPNAKLIAHYRELLAQAQGDADLRLILGALSGAAHPDALQLALPLLGNPGVHAEAEVAVKKIAEAIKAKDPRAGEEALKRLQAK